MKVIRGHHFSFSVADLDRSKEFYGQFLGFEEIARPDFSVPGVWYKVGETEVHLIEKPAHTDVGQPSPQLTPLAGHSAFQIENYADAVEALTAAGVEIIELGEEVGQLFLRDPDGNIIELIELGGRLGALPSTD